MDPENEKLRGLSENFTDSEIQNLQRVKKIICWDQDGAHEGKYVPVKRRLDRGLDRHPMLSHFYSNSFSSLNSFIIHVGQNHKKG